MVVIFHCMYILRLGLTIEKTQITSSVRKKYHESKSTVTGRNKGDNTILNC